MKETHAVANVNWCCHTYNTRARSILIRVMQVADNELGWGHVTMLRHSTWYRVFIKD